MRWIWPGASSGIRIAPRSSAPCARRSGSGRLGVVTESPSVTTQVFPSRSTLASRVRASLRRSTAPVSERINSAPITVRVGSATSVAASIVRGVSNTSQMLSPRANTAAGTDSENANDRLNWPAWRPTSGTMVLLATPPGPVVRSSGAAAASLSVPSANGGIALRAASIAAPAWAATAASAFSSLRATWASAAAARSKAGAEVGAASGGGVMSTRKLRPSRKSRTCAFGASTSVTVERASSKATSSPTTPVGSCVFASATSIRTGCLELQPQFLPVALQLNRDRLQHLERKAGERGCVRNAQADRQDRHLGRGYHALRAREPLRLARALREIVDHVLRQARRQPAPAFRQKIDEYLLARIHHVDAHLAR